MSDFQYFVNETQTNESFLPEYIEPPLLGESHFLYGDLHNEGFGEFSEPLLENEATLSILEGYNFKNQKSLAYFEHLYESCNKGYVANLNRLIYNSFVTQTIYFSQLVNNINKATNLTPLQIASKNNHLEVVNLLLQQKEVIVDMVNDSNETALSIASVNSKSNIPKILIENGADLMHQDNDGFTPLHNAVSKNNLELVQQIMKKNTATANQTNNRGYTPLMIAVVKDFIQIIEFMLHSSENLDLFVKNDSNETAYCIAVNMHKLSTCLLFQNKIGTETLRLNTNYFMVIVKELQKKVKIQNKWSKSSYFEMPENKKTIIEKDFRFNDEWIYQTSWKCLSEEELVLGKSNKDVWAHKNNSNERYRIWYRTLKKTDYENSSYDSD